MTEFISIKDAKAKKEGSFVATVKSAGKLTSGTTNDGRDWTKKPYILEDTTDVVTFVSWNSEVSLDVGTTYEFRECWWKVHNGTVSLQLGNKGKIEKATIPPTTTKPPQTTEDPPKSIQSLPDLAPYARDLVSKDTVLLLQIEHEVRETMKEFMAEGNIVPQQVGMFVRLIYGQLKQKENSSL
jgi:hypothetical protein